jgi:hypothetical protein
VWNFYLILHLGVYINKAELFAEHLENTFTPNTGEDIEDELDDSRFWGLERGP